MVVSAKNMSATVGHLTIGSLRVACALGRTGLTSRKREGDGATPIGTVRPKRVYFRSDRMRRRPTTPLPLKPLRNSDGWCDAAGDRNYNRMVTHPYGASAERMWRDDRLYDVVIVTDHNERPRIQGLGSAIFFHIAREGYPPTEGCVAIAPCDMKKVLPLLTAKTKVIIQASHVPRKPLRNKEK